MGLRGGSLLHRWWLASRLEKWAMRSSGAGFIAVLLLVGTIGRAEGVLRDAASRRDVGQSSEEFEVASVKENRSDGESKSNFSLDSGNAYSTVDEGAAVAPQGGYFSATNQPLMRYIVFAYKLNGTQELALRFNLFKGLGSNVPAWVNLARFDIEARAEGHPTKDQMRRMMQVVLRERFGLVAHWEERQAPVFGLVLAKAGKTGPQLRTHVEDSCRVGSAAPRGMPGLCGVLAHVQPNAPGRVSFGGRGVTLDLLATSLPTQTGMMTVPRPVIDETGLEGSFDLRLEWVLETGDGKEVSGPTFQEALREQLGLRLSARKGMVRVLVIDRVERPGEN